MLSPRWCDSRDNFVHAWLLFRQARTAPLDAAEACLGSGADGSATVSERAIWGQIFALRSATDYMNHESFEHSVASAERALEWLPVTEEGARSIALGYWALAKQALGDGDEALRRLEEALADPAPSGLISTQLYHGLCLVQYLAGDLHQWLGATQRSLAFPGELNHINAITGAHWLAGLLHYEWNDLGVAATHFRLPGLVQVSAGGPGSWRSPLSARGCWHSLVPLGRNLALLEWPFGLGM